MAKKKGTLEEREAEARLRLGKGEDSDANALARERGRREGNAQKRAQTQIVRALEAEVKTYEERQAIIDALVNAPAPKPYKLTKKRGEGKRLPAAAYVMPASDWHIEELVRPENVNGKNEYNLDIAEERVEKFFRSNLTMLNAARSAWEISTVVFPILGDIITGYIHEEYEEENQLSPTQATLRGHDMLVKGIDYLLAKSDAETILIPTANGNHGRTTKKIRVATYAANSLEWLMYSYLQRHYAKEPRVKFQIGQGYNNVVDLYGFRINFSHGDAIGFGGGVGGLSIPVNRRIGREASAIPIQWEGTEKGAPHLNVFGHFHVLQYPRFFICNGSLIGWNDFAERIGCPYSPPEQCSFVVDDKHKTVSNFNPIYVA